VAVNKELAQAEGLKQKIKDVLEGFKDSGRKKINLTDPDCAVMHSVQGSHASYNVQSVVDDQHGLIVHAEAVSATSDVNQFAEQIQQANETMNKLCEVGCADAGYADTAELKNIDEQGIKVVVPSQRQALRMTRRKIVTFVPSKTSSPMSSSTQSAARSTIGSASQDFVIVVFITGNAPRTRTVGGSCAWCSKISRRDLKHSMRLAKRFMPEGRPEPSIPLDTSKGISRPMALCYEEKTEFKPKLHCWQRVSISDG